MTLLVPPKTVSTLISYLDIKKLTTVALPRIYLTMLLTVLNRSLTALVKDLYHHTF
jgi:hypothetical protein